MDVAQTIDWSGAGRTYGAQMIESYSQSMLAAIDAGIWDDALAKRFADIVIKATMDQMADLLRIGIAIEPALEWCTSALNTISVGAAREAEIWRECAATVAMASAPPKNSRH